MQKKHIVSYSFGIDKDLRQIHRVEYQKLYNLPLINEVYLGGYGSIKENKPNEIGVSISKLF